MGEEGGETVVGMLNKYIFLKKGKKNLKFLEQDLPQSF